MTYGMDDNQFSKLLDTILITGQETIFYKYTVIISIITSISLIIVTIWYVVVTKKTLQHLQKSFNYGNELRNNIINQSRMIDISNQWHSIEYVGARNKAILTIEENTGVYNLYDKLKFENKILKWINISLIAHFLLRLDKLIYDNQIDVNQAILEFGSHVDYWCPKIIPIFSALEDEDRIVNAQISLLATIGKARKSKFAIKK